MNKYIQKLSQWGIFFIFLVSCSTKEQITFQSCPAIQANSYCSNLGRNLKHKILEDHHNYRFIARASSGEYANFISLMNNRVNAAMIFYDLMKTQKEYARFSSSLIVSKSSILVPLLVVSKTSFPYTSIARLRKKNWRIGVPNNVIQIKIFQNILQNFRISYELIKTSSISYPSLLLDEKIDFFMCLSSVCSENLSKVSGMLGGIRLLELPLQQEDIPYYLLPIQLPHTFLKKHDVSLPQLPIHTLAIREYLSIRGDVAREKQKLLLNIFEHELLDNPYELFL